MAEASVGGLTALGKAAVVKGMKDNHGYEKPKGISDHDFLVHPDLPDEAADAADDETDRVYDNHDTVAKVTSSKQLNRRGKDAKLAELTKENPTPERRPAAGGAKRALGVPKKRMNRDNVLHTLASGSPAERREVAAQLSDDHIKHITAAVKHLHSKNMIPTDVVKKHKRMIDHFHKRCGSKHVRKRYVRNMPGVFAKILIRLY